MGLIEGPFPQVTFCGASVLSLSSSVGWNEASSTVSVTLVEDPDFRQRFSRPQVGTPQKFVFEKFIFEGLVQRWLQKNAIDGKPTFEVILTDPREILAGTQVILSSYRGNVGNFANLLNVYGYWEDRMGFGGALTNESGMIWNSIYEIIQLSNRGSSFVLSPSEPIGILPAIHILTSGSNTNRTFGAPLRFMGHNYRVDLSGLPIPPAYYRLGGVSSSILDMVSEICQDGGHDFICFLNNGVISFKTVSRVRQPDPGQIGNFINSRSDVISNSIGMELRNDITNAVLLGGDVTELVMETNPTGDDTIWPYWDMDIDGSVIVGKGAPESSHTFHLNASTIADIVGGVTYPCDIPELRCALIDFDSWAYYVLKWYPDKAETINLISAVDSQSDLASLFSDTIFTRDLIDDSQNAVDLFGPMNDNTYWTQRAQRVYEFVRQYASDYYGTKFLVKIPFFIYYKIEPETTYVVKSSEPTDAAYQAEGSLPLGLNFLNETFFLAPDGRFQCFVKYSNLRNVDTQKLSPTSTVFQGNDIYVRATVDMDIGVVYPGGSFLPYCVVAVDNPVYQQADDPLGTIEDVAAILDYKDVGQLQLYAAGLRYDSFPIKIHPPAFRPDAIAIPIKSNRDCYGPWFTSGGVDGKVSFERDESLVPWNYGDYGTMNQAAMAKLANAATRMQYTETGSVEVAGTPDYSLGDTLIAGGPQLTGIDISIGSSGVTTAYNMQTFTPRFGAFAKDNADRLRRLGMAAAEMRRAIRNLYQRNLNISNIIGAARLGFMENASRAVRQQTPHQCLLANMTWDKDYFYRTQVATMTASEVIANCRGDNKDIWPYTAMMTMEGLLRPFSTNWQRELDDPLNDMPHYEKIQAGSYPITRGELDPFGEFNDVDYISWGDEYPGRAHTLKDADGGDPTNSRLLGLRGPLVMVGWGYTYTGKPVPNPDDDGTDILGENEWSDSFIEKHRNHMEEWKAGPVGLYWDNWRKMWTIPTFLVGSLDTNYVATGTMMTIKFGGYSPGDKVKVFSPLGGENNLTQGLLVIAGYEQQTNRWLIISAQCPIQTS